MFSCCICAITSLRPNLKTENFFANTISFGFRFRCRGPRYHSFIWAVVKLRRCTTTLLVAAFLRIIGAVARSRPDLEAVDLEALARLWFDGQLDDWHGLWSWSWLDFRGRLSSTRSNWFFNGRAFLELGDFATTVVVAALLCAVGAVAGLRPDLDAVDLEALARYGLFSGFRSGNRLRCLCGRGRWLDRAGLTGVQLVVALACMRRCEGDIRRMLACTLDTFLRTLTRGR